MTSSMRRVFEVFPRLGPHLRKGECGKVGVVGGAAEYTGAPFFAAMTPMKIGADLSYVFCPAEAAPVIKGYSPELIVFPGQELERVQAAMDRLDSLVVGPGWGRDRSRLPLLKAILARARTLRNLAVVIDADGLYFLTDCLEELRGNRNVVLTPNHREFDRLYSAVFAQDPQAEGEKTADHVKKLAGALQVNVCRKGTVDVITDGKEVLLGEAQGCERRCGGQGDLLSGAVALFVFWQRLHQASDTLQPRHILAGAQLASDFIRFCSRHTFAKIGRSMNAGDILQHIRYVVQENDV